MSTKCPLGTKKKQQIAVILNPSLRSRVNSVKNLIYKLGDPPPPHCFLPNASNSLRL